MKTLHQAVNEAYKKAFRKSYEEAFSFETKDSNSFQTIDEIAIKTGELSIKEYEKDKTLPELKLDLIGHIGLLMLSSCSAKDWNKKINKLMIENDGVLPKEWNQQVVDSGVMSRIDSMFAGPMEYIRPGTRWEYEMQYSGSEPK
jgi:hypothetical protein